MTRRVRVALKAAVWVVALAPLVGLLHGFWTDDLTVNPIEHVTRTLGETALQLLLASLALTPLRIVFGIGWPVTLRRLLGLFAFVYVCLHFAVWVVLDHFFDWGTMADDVLKRPWITVGVAALVLLAPLAATSTTGMIRRLGGVAWRRLHRLVYVAAVLAVLHYLWLAKKVLMAPWVYAAVLAVLLGVRRWWRRDAEAPRDTLTPMRRAVVLLLGLLLAGCAASAPARNPSSAPAPAANPKPAREVLPNGVVLITQEHRAADVVAVQVWMKIGGRDEQGDELGLTHYLEHMLFKGTPTRPPGSIDRLIEGIGGTSNAFTGYDFTHYDFVVPAAHLQTALEVLADITVNAAFVPEELAAEKKVVFEEMNLTEDDPERFLARRLAEVAYRGHPYGRPILGTRELLTVLDRDRLNAYYTKYYVPRNMVVVVVGPVTREHVRSLVGATFGRLSGPPAARPPAAAVPPLTGGRRDDVPRPEQQAYLGMAWQAAATGTASDDIPAVDLLTYILGDGPSSRLNQAVREAKGLVQSIEATYVTRQLSGLVSVTARLDPRNLEAAEAAILHEVQRLAAEGVSETERQRAIVTAESFYAFDIETAEGLARSYGQAETTWTLDNELRYLERLRQVTAAQIQAAARTYLRDDALARVRFQPRAAR